MKEFSSARLIFRLGRDGHPTASHNRSTSSTSTLAVVLNTTVVPVARAALDAYGPSTTSNSLSLCAYAYGSTIVADDGDDDDVTSRAELDARARAPLANDDDDDVQDADDDDVTSRAEFNARARAPLANDAPRRTDAIAGGPTRIAVARGVDARAHIARGRREVTSKPSIGWASLGASRCTDDDDRRRRSANSDGRRTSNAYKSLTRYRCAGARARGREKRIA